MSMGQRSPRMEAQRAAAAPPPHLAEDVYAEILAWLPLKSVLRFRAVCRAWRDITARPHFLAAHARRQPAQVVLYTYLDSGPRGVALDVLPVSGDDGTADQQRRRRLIWYTRSKLPSPLDPLLLDSCNGVLLFRKDAAGVYFLCNPATRQWAELPKLTDDQSYGGHRTVNVREYAFYFHQQSGEYRLLCRHDTTAGRTWCILSTGADEPRQVDTRAAADTDDDYHQLVMPDTPSKTTPVALHDSMHWPPRRRPWSPAAKQDTTEMVVFDVQSEKFHLMPGPRTATRPLMKLFVMDGGLLVAANFGAGKHVDLWFLVDYDAGRWERRHQVPTPWQSMSSYSPSDLWSTAAACDDQTGNIMLGSRDRGLLVYNVRRMKTVRILNSVATPRNNVLVSRHVFRESLVEHPNFKRPSSADLPFNHFWC